MTMLLEARNLCLEGRLDKTSLSLGAGQLVCLVGPNGSGKTSLLHALAGIGSPDGDIWIDGENPKGLHPDRRKCLFTFLPASRDIKWPLKAKDLIALGLPSQAQEKAFEQIARDLDLSGLLDRRVDRLSTGERSRVLIARALAAAPKLLLLDEPVANLDPLWQLKLMNYLQQLAHREGRTVLLAVHDLEIARRYADRLIVVSEGRIEADGDPHMVLDGADIPRIFGIEYLEGSWRPAA